MSAADTQPRDEQDGEIVVDAAREAAASMCEAYADAEYRNAVAARVEGVSES